MLTEKRREWITYRVAIQRYPMSLSSMKRLVIAGRVTRSRPGAGKVLLDAMELERVIEGAVVRPEGGPKPAE